MAKKQSPKKKTAKQLDAEIAQILWRRKVEGQQHQRAREQRLAREGMTLVGRRIGTAPGTEETTLVAPTATVPHYAQPDFHLGGPGSTIAGEPEIPQPRGTTSTWQPGDDERRRKVVFLLSERPKTPQEWHEHDLQQDRERHASDRRARERWAQEQQAHEEKKRREPQAKTPPGASYQLPVAKTHNGKKRQRVRAFLQGLLPRKKPA